MMNPRTMPALVCLFGTAIVLCACRPDGPAAAASSAAAAPAAAATPRAVAADVAASDANASAAATFDVPATQVPEPLRLIAYGDMRFTDAHETSASQPTVRLALVNRVAAEEPLAIFVNGDLPWHGTAADYDVYRAETAVWRTRHLRVYPALGNHEFAQCAEARCLELWWTAFPDLRARRWYSVKIGGEVLGIALDSDAALLPGSPQRLWLESQMNGAAKRVRFVLIILHHPPVADVQTGQLADHNPRPNEAALADYLSAAAPTLPGRVLVSAGHIHNYERFERDGVIYLVSGGGGAHPYEVDRTPADRYRQPDFPNYHYVRMTFTGSHLAGEMLRLRDFAAAQPHEWEIRDRFEADSRR
jgi:hypothetical protein